MNLKKIIREEMGDMWQDMLHEEPNIWLSYQIVFFDEIPTTEEVVKLIKDAFKSGFLKQEAIDSWEAAGLENEANKIINKKTLYLRLSLINRWLYYGSYYEDVIKLYPELKVIKYSEAKNYLVNESEEDSGLGWIMKVNATPISMDDQWILVNDIDPSNIEEGIEIQKYLMNLGYDWLVKGMGPIQRKIYTMHHFPTKGLRGDLTYYSDREKGIANDTMEENKNAKIYYWSEVKPTYIKESEEDEWSWARNSFISSNEIRLGNKIRIHNLGDEESFLSWLGDYKEGFLDGEYGDQIEGVVNHIDGDNFSLYTGDDTIKFPTEERMLDLASSRRYKNLNIGYEII
jgi:hypothetical protein